MMNLDQGELLANSNLAKVLDVTQEIKKQYIIPTGLKQEIDDLGFVGGGLFIASSRRTEEEIQSKLSYDSNIAGAEFSLNKRAIDDYLKEPSISISDAFGIFLAASRHAKRLSLSLGVKSIHCGFFVPTEVSDVVRPPHHAVWTLFRGGGELAYDPYNLEDFKAEAAAHLLM